MRKALLVYLLTIAAPAVLVAVGGLFLVRGEVARLRQEERVYAMDAGRRLSARAQRELLGTVRDLAVRYPADGDRLVRNAFKWTRGDGLVEPLRATATATGSSAAARTSPPVKATK